MAMGTKISGSSKGAARVGRKRLGQDKTVRRTPAGKLGAHIERLATAANLTAPELGKRIGKSEDAVWAYYRGTRAPHIDLWPKLAKALGLKSTHDLLPPDL